MHPIALTQAADRLNQASEAVAAMGDTKDPARIELHWIQFLVAANTFYSKLERGSKDSGKSAAWYGRKKHERRTDELFKYLHHARNADEHGIEQITQRASSFMTLGPGAEATLISDGKSSWTVHDVKGEIGYPQDLVRLFRVHDRKHGNSFDPPTRHLGQALTDLTPIAVATVALGYLQNMLMEARLL
jgi:hypothetical protein